MDIANSKLNNQKHVYLSSSIIPQSLIPPSVGVSSDLDTYVRNPTLRQPSKKSFQGTNASSTITAAFSTSLSASSARISIYNNKRNALVSPAKGGAPILKDAEVIVQMMSLEPLGTSLKESRKEAKGPYSTFDFPIRQAGPQEGVREVGSKAFHGSH